MIAVNPSSSTPRPSPSHPSPSVPRSGFRPAGMLAITCLAGALSFVLATRPLPEAAAATAADPTPSGDSGELGAAKPDPSEPPAAQAQAQAQASGADSSAADAPLAEAAQPRRTLRVVGLGWELLAPIVLSNDGLERGDQPLAEAERLDLSASVAHDISELEVRLARGGLSEDGADLALLPLPAFVASYERLRALDPQVFFVLGWSRGRDALAAEDALLLRSAPPRGRVELVGSAGQSATMLGLFALDELGVEASQVELVAPSRDGSARARLRAVERASTVATASFGHGVSVDNRDLVLTSADAPHLIPLVAIAPGSFIRAHTDELSGFTRAWLAGTELLASDAPAAARRIAEESGAPEAVALLNAIAYLEYGSLADAARVAGLSGRDALSLEHLFMRSWQLWRGVGVLSTPAPERAPLANSVLERVVLGQGSARIVEAEPPERSGERLLLVRDLPAGASVDHEQLIETLGLLAGIFARGELELRVHRDKAASEAIVAEAVERFGLDAERVRVGPRLRKRAPAVRIQVYVP